METIHGNTIKTMPSEESKYRSILNLIKEAVLVLDEKYTIIDANKTASIMLCKVPTDLLNRPVKDFIVKEHWASFYMLLNMDGETEVDDVQIAKNDNDVLDTRIKINRLNSPQGFSTILIVNDITKEKNDKLELLRFSNAIKYAANPIQITDAKGKMIYVNPAFERASGYDKSELIGKDPNILNSGRHSKEYWERVWTKILSGNVWVGRIENVRKDGTRLFFNSIISPIIDSEDELVGFLAVHNDISEQKLLQQHFVTAQRLGSIGTLAAGIAHEVGNPLTSISSITQMICRRTNDVFVQEKLEQIKNQTNRIAHVIRQLVDFSIPSFTDSKSNDINQILTGSINMVRMGMNSENIEFSTKLADNLPMIDLVPDKLMQVFVNILMNSVDALDAKTGKIEVSSELKNGLIEIKIKDSGKGITWEAVENIFEPFYTTKEVGKGTGLGLWVSYGIIKNLGGDIHVDSEIGQGSTFTINLPLNLK